MLSDRLRIFHPFLTGELKISFPGLTGTTRLVAKSDDQNQKHSENIFEIF